MKLSTYQENIIDWVVNGTGNACCDAVAGSSKSTTLRLAALALAEKGVHPSQIKICVFGKANSQDLLTKFGRGWENSISTLHSAGWSLLKQHLSFSYAQIDTRKYSKIAKKFNFTKKKSYLIKNKIIGNDKSFTKLLDLIRLTNSSYSVESIEEICEHFELSDIFDYEQVLNPLIQCLDEGERLANRSKNPQFDFTDQIWLPVKWQLTKKDWFTEYSYLLVDEGQDFNKIQLELAIGLAGKKGRTLFVADKNQSIMGFSGADCNSYENILIRTKAIELPLSVCYRCPKSHLELVRDIFPDIPIEAKPDAVEGTISTIRESDLWGSSDSKLITGDMVLSRKTAPLVTLCIKLISQGIAATVKGKAIGELLKEDLKEISEIYSFTYSDFHRYLEIYRNNKQSKFYGKDNSEQLIETLRDKLKALSAIYVAQSSSTSIKDLEDYIDTLFSDGTSPITLSTCHRAKGLEAERVFIVEPESLPLSWKNQNEWQLKQEYNLLYVALTRSKSDLFIVGQPRWMKIKEEKTNE